jgi:hypothetical protein
MLNANVNKQVATKEGESEGTVFGCLHACVSLATQVFFAPQIYKRKEWCQSNCK